MKSHIFDKLSVDGDFEISKDITDILKYENKENVTSLNIKDAIIVDFSHNTITNNLLQLACEFPLTIVTGTSNINIELLEKAKSNSCILHETNFSQGYSLISHIIENLPKEIDFNDITILDHHGKHKKEKPSETSKMLKIACSKRWPNNKFEVESMRYGLGVSEHTLLISFLGEELKISSNILTRDAFLKNLKIAIKFIKNKDAGLYSLQDCLRN